jgi:hypothetical protein
LLAGLRRVVRQPMRTGILLVGAVKQSVQGGS